MDDDAYMKYLDGTAAPVRKNGRRNKAGSAAKVDYASFNVKAYFTGNSGESRTACGVI